ncbi:hypothetical protein EDB92DRAFT_1820829 [Lactarius akahatsu]|uniref:Uncharacterized protein n=1 Tax=Lactarius akahatsu TaxID=416441 RepID=A0AAD4Q2Z4_9AGAM|nr:hypothetical protein EDB92DRAFT_1820829 [Lactarius akahatsu]
MSVCNGMNKRMVTGNLTVTGQGEQHREGRALIGEGFHWCNTLSWAIICRAPLYKALNCSWSSEVVSEKQEAGNAQQPYKTGSMTIEEADCAAVLYGFSKGDSTLTRQPHLPFGLVTPVTIPGRRLGCILADDTGMDKREAVVIMTTTGNLHDPFIKFLHVVGGIYMKKPYRWSIWLYSGCRFLALFAIFTTLIGFCVVTPINCRFFTYASFVLASMLIIMHIVAIWEKNQFICAIVFTSLLVNISFYVCNMIWLEAIWSTQQATCLVTKTDRNMICFVTLGENLVFLTLLFLGKLTSIIYPYGILWFLIVAVAEIPKTIFQTFELVVMAIGASYIYRALANYSTRTNIDWENERFLSVWGLPSATFAATNNLPTDPIQFNTLSESRSHTGTSSGPQAIHSPLHSLESLHSCTYSIATNQPLPPTPILLPEPHPQLAPSHS